MVTTILGQIFWNSGPSLILISLLTNPSYCLPLTPTSPFHAVHISHTPVSSCIRQNVPPTTLLVSGNPLGVLSCILDKQIAGDADFVIEERLPADQSHQLATELFPCEHLSWRFPKFKIHSLVAVCIIYVSRTYSTFVWSQRVPTMDWSRPNDLPHFECL